DTATVANANSRTDAPVSRDMRPPLSGGSTPQAMTGLPQALHGRGKRSGSHGPQGGYCAVVSLPKQRSCRSCATLRLRYLLLWGEAVAPSPPSAYISISFERCLAQPWHDVCPNFGETMTRFDTCGACWLPSGSRAATRTCRKT